MPSVTPSEAVERLAQEVETGLPPDVLLEVHNELFPTTPATQAQARTDRQRLTKPIVDLLRSATVDRVTDLWSGIPSRYRNVWYNEEDDLIHYSEDDGLGLDE